MTEEQIHEVCACGNLPDYSAQIAAQKATAAINEANQKLAKIPEDVMKNLQEAIAKLLKLVNGWENTSELSFDPDKVIADIQKLLDPVVNTLLGIINSVGLPSIPGLDKIAELLTALSSMKPMPKPEGYEGPWPKPGNLPDFPPELMQLLADLLSAIQSLCMTLPMVCVNILFNTVDLILKTGIPVVGMNFYDIITAVPFVREIPALVSLAPKITDMIANVPGKIGIAVQGKVKQQLKAMSDLQIPDPPKDIEVQPPTPCSSHG